MWQCFLLFFKFSIEKKFKNADRYMPYHLELWHALFLVLSVQGQLINYKREIYI
jgi:hypothetical protein